MYYTVIKHDGHLRMGEGGGGMHIFECFEKRKGEDSKSKCSRT